MSTARSADLRARWLGHTIRAEVNVTVSEEQLSATQAHDVAVHVVHALHEKVHFLSEAMVHVDPVSSSGERHHQAVPVATGHDG